jgi:amino acid transporter
MVAQPRTGSRAAAVAPGSSSVGRYGRRVGFAGLLALLFASLSSGAGGIEEVVAASGPGMALWLFLLLPMVWGLPNVLINAELSSALPVEGGYYRWCRRALGPFWGFLAGWWTWIGSVFDNVVYPVIIAEYCGALWEGLSGAGGRRALVVGLIALFGYLNYRGIRAVAVSSAVFCVLVLLPWIVFTALAAPLAAHNPFEPLVSPGRTPAGGLGVALVVAMWFFSGYELPSAAAEEYERSHRSLPIALMMVLPLAALSYVLPLAAGLAFAEDWAQWSDGSLALVAERAASAWGGPPAGRALGAALVFAVGCGSAALFNGLLVPYSRILLVMAEEGDLPRGLARLHPRHRTPWVAILVNCALYALLHPLDFSDLVLLSMWNSFAAYLVIAAAVVALRRREPALPRPFQIRGGAAGLAAVLAPIVVLIGWAFWQSGQENWTAGNARVLLLGAGGLVSGPLLYGLKLLSGRFSVNLSGATGSN